MDAIEEMCFPNAIGHGQAQHKVDVACRSSSNLHAVCEVRFPIFVSPFMKPWRKGTKYWLAGPHHGSQRHLSWSRANRSYRRITGMSLQRIANGKIAEAWDNWDQLGLLVQIGGIPAAEFVSAKNTAKAS